MNRPDFPHVIDSTLLSQIRSCGRKAQLESLLHWKPKNPSVHLHAGAAFARGLEVARLAYYVEGLDAETSMAKGLGALLEAYGDFECPEDSAKSASRMAGAFEFYFEAYPFATDKAVPTTLPSGKKAIEFSFAEPIDVVHPVTGDPLIFCGRFDMMADYAGGTFGYDDKTTSQLGASWSKQWDLRSQFTAYTWGANQAGFNLQGFLVRGISILKTKYDTQQAITYRPQWQIDRWYKQMCKDVEDFRRQWESGEYDYNLDASCNEYGGCLFSQICLSHPQNQDQWLRASFIQRRWDPLTRSEILMGEEL